MRKTVSIYADGSSTGNSKGPMGWGWLITDWEDIICAGSAGAPLGTNNIAELQAAIAGLRACIDRGLHVDNDVELVSDSMYCLGLASSQYQASTHFELVKVLQELYKTAKARTRWVRGHSGDAFNDKCDELAKAGRDIYTTGEPKKRRRWRRREVRRQKRQAVKRWKLQTYGTTKVTGREYYR